MKGIDIKNAENKKKLKKAKMFAVPCLLLNWVIIMISIWAIFSGNGFIAIGDEAGALVIGFFAILGTLAMAIGGCVMIKTCVNICNLKMGNALKIDMKMEDKTYLNALAYLDRMIGAMRLSVWLAILVLFFGSIFGGSKAYQNHVWALVLISLVIVHVLPNIYWKSVCNTKVSLAALFDWLVDLVKAGLVVVLIVLVKNVELDVTFTELGIARFSALSFSPDTDMKFSALMLEFVSTILKIVFMGIIWCALEAPLEDLIEKKAKKAMIWGIVLTVIDLVLFMLMPSAVSMMENLWRWFVEARLWWIPIILVLIALQVSNKFPTGVDIYDDIRQNLKKSEIVTAEKKARSEVIVQEEVPSAQETIQE